MDAPRIVRDGIDVRRAGSDAALHLRFPAFLIDAGLLLLLGLALALLDHLTGRGLGPVKGPALQLGFEALLLPVSILYFVLMECSPLQATLGKRAMGLKVTNTAGLRIGPIRSFWRTFLKLAFALTCCVGLLSLLLINMTRHLPPHDTLAGCVVVPAGPSLPEGIPPPDTAPETPSPHTEGITARDGIRENG